MRLAVSNIAWDRRDDAAVARVLREEGCRAIEVAPTKWRRNPVTASRAEIAAYREWWESQLLPIVALQALLFGREDLQLFGAASVRQELFSYLQRMIEVASGLGAGVLVFGSPGNRRRGSLSIADAMEIAVPFFREVGHYARANQVQLCIEPNPPAYGCDFVTTMAEAVDLCRHVAHPGFRVHGDLGCLTLNRENVIDALIPASLHLAHFHISEPYLAHIGVGGSDHATAALGLSNIGYTGWTSIEMRATETRGDTLQTLRRALRLANAVYRGDA